MSFPLTLFWADLPESQASISRWGWEVSVRGLVVFKAYFLILYDLGCLSEALPRSPGTMKADLPYT